MKKNESFLQKLRTVITLLFCLTFVAGAGVAFGKKTQNMEAYAARHEEFETVSTEVEFAEMTKVRKRIPVAYEDVCAVQPIADAPLGSFVKASVYKIVNNSEEPKTAKFEEISTAALAKNVLENIEQETLQLMGSPAGTSWGGMIKVYAGKTPLLVTEDDKEVLLRIVEAEATSEDVKGRMLVANVVLNRVLSKGFPNSIAEVVFQKNGNVYQFSPIKDGRYWSVKVSDKTREAVERVLAGEDESQGALFFVARRMANQNAVRWFDEALQYLFQYGVHEFYKNK